MICITVKSIKLMLDQLESSRVGRFSYMGIMSCSGWAILFNYFLSIRLFIYLRQAFKNQKFHMGDGHCGGLESDSEGKAFLWFETAKRKGTVGVLKLIYCIFEDARYNMASFGTTYLSRYHFQHKFIAKNLSSVYG